MTPKLWPSALCLSRSPGLLNRRPGVHSAGCWLSLLHLVYLWLQLYSPVLNCTASVKFVGLILPSNSHAVIWTRLHASAISSDICRSGCATSAIFGMACVIVIERKYLSCSSEVTLIRCVSLWEYNGIFLTRPISSANFRPRDFLS